MEVIIKYITPKIYKDVETQTESIDLKTDDNIFCGCIQLDEIKSTILKPSLASRRYGHWLRIKPLMKLLKEHGIKTTSKNEREFLINNKIIEKVQGSHYRIIDLQKYYNHYVI